MSRRGRDSRHEEVIDHPQLGRVRFRPLSPGQLRSIEKEIEEADLDARVDEVRQATGKPASRESEETALRIEKVLDLALVEPQMVDAALHRLGADFDILALANPILDRSGSPLLFTEDEDKGS